MALEKKVSRSEEDVFTTYQREQHDHQYSSELANELKTEFPHLTVELTTQLTREGYRGLTPHLMANYLTGHLFELLKNGQDPTETYFYTAEKDALQVNVAKFQQLRSAVLDYYYSVTSQE